MRVITKKQQLFVDEYLIDLNATAAAKRAGYSEKTAYSMGQRLLKNVEVQKAIQKAMQERSERTEITQDAVLSELSKIAFASGADFARVAGSGHVVELVDTDELTADKRAAISCIKETKFGIAVESYDKVKALELLGRHLGMFVDRVEHSGSIAAPNPYAGLTTEELRKLAGGDG